MVLSGILYRLLPTFISNKNQKLMMSTKRESDKATTRISAEDDTIGVETSTSTTTSSSSLSGQRHSVERAIEETKDNLKKTIDEARREIPRNTEAINNYQEHTLQTTKQITDSYLDSPKEIIEPIQSIWIPYVDSTRPVFWDNWASERVTEIYARTVSNCADNAVATTRIANNAIFANMGAFRTFIDREKNDVKELSRIAANTAKTFEQTTRDTA